MPATIDCRVYLQDHFPETPIAALAADVEERFKVLPGTRVHLLCQGRAMAVEWTGKATFKGRNPENLANSRLGEPVARYIHAFTDVAKPLIFRFDNICFQVPASKYAVGLWLPPRELSRKFIQIKSRFVDADEEFFVCRLIRQLGWSPTAKAQLMETVQRWAGQVSDEPGFGGERLARVPEISAAEGDNEIVVRIPAHERVTFPWLELYLRIRESLPRRDWSDWMTFSAPRARPR